MSKGEMEAWLGRLICQRVYQQLCERQRYDPMSSDEHVSVMDAMALVLGVIHAEW